MAPSLFVHQWFQFLASPPLPTLAIKIAYWSSAEAFCMGGAWTTEAFPNPPQDSFHTSEWFYFWWTLIVIYHYLYHPQFQCMALRHIWYSRRMIAYRTLEVHFCKMSPFWQQMVSIGGFAWNAFVWGIDRLNSFLWEYCWLASFDLFDDDILEAIDWN